MSVDQKFNMACRLLDKAAQIWEAGIVDKYAVADRCYREGMEIYEDVFLDKKKVLTDDLCPF
jgi:hypothetical protein